MKYKIIQNGQEIGVSPTIVYVCMGKNGSFQECEKDDAEGFCVKLPSTISIIDEETNDEIEQIGIFDTVFSFQGHNLPGSCGEASIIEVSENI